MRYSSNLVSMGLAASGATVAGADQIPIYYDACQTEVSAFQQASNDNVVADARHALVLCLADDAYVAETQSPSEFKEWPESRHFRIFTSVQTVAIGDTWATAPSLARTDDETAGVAGGGLFLSDGARRCTCRPPSLTRD